MLQAVRYLTRVTPTTSSTLAGAAGAAGAAVAHFGTAIPNFSQYSTATSGSNQRQEADVVDCVVVGAGE
jgi:hypothetical protein